MLEQLPVTVFHTSANLNGNGPRLSQERGLRLPRLWRYRGEVGSLWPRAECERRSLNSIRLWTWSQSWQPFAARTVWL